jgi:hypothetical protein
VVAFRVRWSTGSRPSCRRTTAASGCDHGRRIDPAEARLFLSHPNCLTDAIDRYIGRRDHHHRVHAGSGVRSSKTPVTPVVDAAAPGLAAADRRSRRPDRCGSPSA